MLNDSISRRRAIQLLAVAGSAPLLLRYGTALAGIETPFGLGVASGDPWPDGFVIWTRLALLPLLPGCASRLPASVPVSWEVAADADMRVILQRGTTRAHSLRGHAVHVELKGLPPDRVYWYRFTALGTQSAIGRAITMPLPQSRADSLKLVVASCAHWERGYFSAYRHMAAEQPDLVLFLGDYIYEYSLEGERARQAVRPYGSAEATDLEGYRYRYALHHSDPDLQTLHAAAPWIVTWDDHEVQDDYSGAWSKDPGVTLAAFRQRQAAAYQAFLENMPVRQPYIGANGEVRLYRRLRYGDLASIPVLDGRQYRSRQPCADKPPFGKGHMEAATCLDLTDPTRTQLGWEQETWLYKGFAEHDTQWTLIAQDLLMASLRAPDLQGGADRYWTDSWDGYQAARTRFLQAVAEQKVRNPVVLSGDYHSFWANELRLDPDKPESAVIATELVGTSITSDGPSQTAVEAVLPVNPHIRFFDSRWRGYMLLELNRERLLASFRAISDRADRNASVHTLSQHVVQSGNPRLIEG